MVLMRHVQSCALAGVLDRWSLNTDVLNTPEGHCANQGHSQIAGSTAAPGPAQPHQVTGGGFDPFTGGSSAPATSAATVGLLGIPQHQSIILFLKLGHCCRDCRAQIYNLFRAPAPAAVGRHVPARTFVAFTNVPKAEALGNKVHPEVLHCSPRICLPKASWVPDL